MQASPELSPAQAMALALKAAETNDAATLLSLFQGKQLDLQSPWTEDLEAEVVTELRGKHTARDFFVTPFLDSPTEPSKPPDPATNSSQQPDSPTHASKDAWANLFRPPPSNLPTKPDRPLDPAAMVSRHGYENWRNNTTNYALLFTAAKCGSTAALAALIEAGANPHERETEAGTSLAHTAALHGRAGVLETLFAQGADPNARDQYDRTPVHWAAMNGHVDAVATLAARGAELGLPDASNLRPADWAAMNGHVDVLHRLEKAVPVLEPPPVQRAALRGQPGLSL